MKKSFGALCALLFTVLVGRAASAAVCAQLDTSRDTLSEGDRNGAMSLFMQALQQQGLQVVTQGCTETYSVYHVKLGNSITVFMQGPQGYRQATSRSLEEVPAVYSQMVRSLISGQPMSTSNDTVDRTNATSAQQAPNRVEADSLWYVRLGYGGVLGPEVGHGVAAGFGYRYELDQLAIDLSFLNFVVGTSSSSNSGSGTWTASWAKLMALYFLNPTAGRSAYLGGGVSWGGAAALAATTDVNGFSTFQTYTGSGLQGEASAGYEFLRASTIRMFVQADLTLPFYLVHRDAFTITGTTTTEQKSYVPTLAVSFGIGWGRSISRVHLVN